MRKFFHKTPRWMLLYYGLFIFWLSATAMHIPDGYLSPVTSMIMFALVLPFWIRGVQVMRQKMTARNIPLVALFAAFSFVIMMFNIPLPGGTTGHAVGGALAAIVLGPEIASIAISLALIIQALFFGDGGILAIGANSFNMAVVLPFIAYAIYTLLTRQQPAQSRRRIFAAAFGGWAGLTAAAFFTAVEFGIQPAFWHTADGTPLYAPYPLSVAIPAMVIPHALVASVAEAVITSLVLAFLLRTNPSILTSFTTIESEPSITGKRSLRPLWIGLLMLVLLSPIGLLAPGTAWGEWGAEELTTLGFKFIPQGLAHLSTLWSAPLPDYNLPILGNTAMAYWFSALTGVLIVVGLTWLFGALFVRKTPHEHK